MFVSEAVFLALVTLALLQSSVLFWCVDKIGQESKDGMGVIILGTMFAIVTIIVVGMIAGNDENQIAFSFGSNTAIAGTPIADL